MVFSIFMCIVIVFISGFVQGVSSFGFSLLAMPLLAAFMPLGNIVPIFVVINLFINIIVLFDVKKNIEFKAAWFWVLTIASFFGIPVGIKILEVTSPQILKLLLGGLVTLTAVAMIFGAKIKVRQNHVLHAAVGFFSGLMNGCITFSGPPIIVFLSNQGYGKDAFRANLTFFFFISNIFTIVALFFNHMLSFHAFGNIALFTIPIALGVICGIFVSKKINEELFKKIILHFLLIAGLWTICASLLTLR